MNKFDDARVSFYLENRDLIDEWAKISDEVPGLCRKFMWSLKEDLKELATQMGSAISVYEERSSYPKLFLYREHWFSAGDSKFEGRIDAGIGVEWNKNNVDFGLSGNRPYVGVWTNKRTDRGSQLREDLEKTIGEGSSNSFWVKWERMAPTEEIWWENLDSYREVLVESIDNEWEEYSEAIEEAVTQLRAPRTT